MTINYLVFYNIKKADSSKPVQIILESSEDMVNWNSANPGTYGASTYEKFFRVRAVEDTA